MEDHINSNIEPSVPLSVYQELYQVNISSLTASFSTCLIVSFPCLITSFLSLIAYHFSVRLQELGGHRGLSNSSGNHSGRRNFPNIDLQNMELDRGQVIQKHNLS